MISNERAFADTVQIGRLILEEGTVRGRGSTSVPGLTSDQGAAKVNGPSGAKGQYLWDGTYRVELDRGVSIDGVYHLSSFGHSAQDQRVFAQGERVTISWLNRRNVQIPVILDGCTIDFYNKQLIGQGHLLDVGERIIRSAMADTPGATGDYPFADNQFDSPNTSPGKVTAGVSDQNISRIVRLPGAELFLDKFGRIITLSRNPGNEFLITNGKIDSGQDDVSNLTTVADQDAYYAKIIDDESDPINLAEPMAPKPINLYQYQQTVATLKVVGDKDANRTVRRGILPRFDKWIFKPIIVRKYKADSDGEPEAGDTYSTHQERAQTNDDDTNPVYGYVRTVTDYGDIKEFVARHVNRRVVGDVLESVGGNYELKVKAKDRLDSGATNPINLIHREYLKDGTVRLRVNENVGAGTSNFDAKITPAGEVSVVAKKKIVVDSDDKIYLGGETNAQKMVLGDNLKELLDDLYDALSKWVPIPGDGGAALKTALITFFTDYVQSLTPGAPKYYLSSDQKVA